MYYKLYYSVFNVASNDLKSIHYSLQFVELFAVVFLQIYLSFHFLLSFVCVCCSYSFLFGALLPFTLPSCLRSFHVPHSHCVPSATVSALLLSFLTPFALRSRRGDDEGAGSV